MRVDEVTVGGEVDSWRCSSDWEGRVAVRGLRLMGRVVGWVRHG